MSLTLAITIIVLADLALIGVLAFVMSRAKLLTPHAPTAETVPGASACNTVQDTRSAWFATRASASSTSA